MSYEQGYKDALTAAANIIFKTRLPDVYSERILDDVAYEIMSLTIPKVDLYDWNSGQKDDD